MGIVFTKASNINDSVFGKSQVPICMMIEKKAEAFEKTSIINEIFLSEKSDNFAEKVTTMTAMGRFMPTGENGATPQTDWQEGFSKFIEHATWKNGFAISREMIEDNKVLNLKGKPQSFIAAYHRTRESYCAGLLGSAMAGLTELNWDGTKFPTTCADGKPLFDKEHPSAIATVKTKQTNKFSNAFSADVLGKMETAMQNFKGDKDELLGVAPDTIIIPNDHELKKAVFAAIGADKDPDTNHNGFNYQFGRWNVIVWPYLNEFIPAGKKPFVLFDSQYNKDNYGAVLFDRIPLEVHSYIDENTHANKWSGYARFAAGFNDWRAFAIGGADGGTSLS